MLGVFAFDPARISAFQIQFFDQRQYWQGGAGQKVNKILAASCSGEPEKTRASTTDVPLPTRKASISISKPLIDAGERIDLGAQ